MDFCWAIDIVPDSIAHRLCSVRHAMAELTKQEILLFESTVASNWSHPILMYRLTIATNRLSKHFCTNSATNNYTYLGETHHRPKMNSTCESN